MQLIYLIIFKYLMNLFVNAVSSNWVLILFDDTKNIIKRKDIEVLWNESSKLVWTLDVFLKESIISYNDLENIVVVNWPWSFTGIRTIVLLINTINYFINKNITPINYFDLFDKYPICKPSSKRDSFFQKDKDSVIEIIQNPDLKTYIEESHISKVYGELNKDFFENIEVLDDIDYNYILSKVEFKSEKIIKPLYIKKPNIS